MTLSALRSALLNTSQIGAVAESMDLDFSTWIPCTFTLKNSERKENQCLRWQDWQT